MPDTDKNQQAFPQQPCQKQGLGFPIARIVGLALSVGTVTAYCLGAFHHHQFQTRKEASQAIFEHSEIFYIR